MIIDLKAFKAFCVSKDKERYESSNNTKCALAQYLQLVFPDSRVWVGGFGFKVDGVEYDIGQPLENLLITNSSFSELAADLAASSKDTK